jgi:hypothetical protein
MRGHRNVSVLRRAILGSARVSRAGFGVAPKRTLSLRQHVRTYELQREVRDREDALANTRDARAPQT